ncbi:P-II family nitrogen regulator [Candidatus Cyanaurora vandensis]|uniref:P-II family nitrogen regulator n=1 Tax=Candidatus Cyanaurora vandensis TaxID=2714958 RepID=UPI0025804883|nr:P-II family nitrogen regulator [Candidatus Cyanaurora vandensis]
MNKIEAVIRPEKLHDVRTALLARGIGGMTVTEVLGFGRQRGNHYSYRGTSYEATFIKKVKLEVVVPENITDSVVDVLVANARTGSVGDGKIFVTPISRVVRVRTGEENENALTPALESAVVS